MTRRVPHLLDAPSQPHVYPTDTLRNVRDAAALQSARALEMARAAGLPVPDSAEEDDVIRSHDVPAGPPH